MLKEIHLDAIDWNLLRVFEVLFKERSVVRSAERLNLSASAVSHALNRLRHTFQDDLFVRGPAGMQPTPRAEELGARLREGLQQVRLALNPPGFEPARSERRFHIACTNYASTLLVPAVIEHLCRAAPGVGMSVHPFGHNSMSDLDGGRVDMVIGGVDKPAEQFRSEVLFSDARVWVMRADHPAADGPLTVERLAAMPRLVISAPFGMAVVDGVTVEDGPGRQVMTADSLEFQDALRGAPMSGVVFTVTNALAVPAIVGQSDVVALIPRRLAERNAAQHRLRLFEPPHPVRPFEHAMIWHRHLGQHPAMDWLRSLFRETAATI